MIRYILFFALLFLHSICAAQQLQTNKWETVDLSFEATGKIDKPFELEMSCEFTGPDGSKISVSGFYNGDKEWVVRFNPDKEGVWTALSHSSIKSLAGKKYIIKVNPPLANNHGNLKISENNPQKLNYADGTPYDLLAFEADWLFALDYGNPELPKTKQLVDYIALSGFNQVILNVYAYDVKWKQSKNIDPKYDFGSKKEIFPFLGDNENPDYSALNVDFFKHYDKVIDLLEDQGIIAHIMIYVWNKKVNWPAPNSKSDNMYFDYVVKRYQAKSNVLWDISKEALDYGHDDSNYITERIKRLRALDAYDRLVTVHDYKYCSAYPETVDIISVQFWFTDLYSYMIQMKKDFPDKPILNIEHGGYEKCQYRIFEGDYEDPLYCMERNYKCIFAGTYSTYYWKGSSWNVVIYDPFADDVTVQPKFEYYKYMREFLDKINFEKLEPDDNYRSSGFCLANDEEGEYVYYMPKENCSMAVRRLPKAEKMVMQWFNPATGEYQEPYEIDHTRWLIVYPQFEGVDNVLMVKLINKE